MTIGISIVIRAWHGPLRGQTDDHPSCTTTNECHGFTTASIIKAFTEQAKRKHDDFFLPKKTAHASPVILLPSLTPIYENDNHNAFLQHRWNNANKNKPTVHTHKTKKTRTKHKRLLVTKDDMFITPTFETLCTLDTRSSHHIENEDTDAILSLTIWNQQIS